MHSIFGWSEVTRKQFLSKQELFTGIYGYFEQVFSDISIELSKHVKSLN